MDHPKRIVSLVPSLTELLLDLGLHQELIGRTRFCIRPENRVQDIPVVGGTKNPRIDKIRDLKPDLVIANKEENRREDVLELKQHFRVIVTEISSIEDALLTIYELGNIVGKPREAERLTGRISQRLAERPAVASLRTVYFIWREPWMTIGGDTYIHDVLQHWNLENIFGNLTRYPGIELEQLSRRNPELILLSSEPYPFKEKHLPEIKEYCPDAKILLVNGQWFSWYGSRMLSAFEALNTWRKDRVGDGERR